MRQGFRLIILSLAFLLAGCAGNEHTAAQQRWAAQAPERYLLRTVENLRGTRCAQIVEVHANVVEQIFNNTCRHPSLWTIEWLFHRIERADAAIQPCAQQLRGAGCVCRQQTNVTAEYDRALGHPVRIQITQEWRRAWGDQGFWRSILQTRTIPACVPPAADPGWTIIVREVRAMP